TALAGLVNVRGDELVLCSGTTFAINLVAYSWALPRLKAGDVILVTRMEHHANIVPWQLVAERTGAVVRPVDPTPDGALDLDTRINVSDLILLPRGVHNANIVPWQ